VAAAEELKRIQRELETVKATTMKPPSVPVVETSVDTADIAKDPLPLINDLILPAKLSSEAEADTAGAEATVEFRGEEGPSTNSAVPLAQDVSELHDKVSSSSFLRMDRDCPEEIPSICDTNLSNSPILSRLSTGVGENRSSRDEEEERKQIAEAVQYVDILIKQMVLAQSLTAAPSIEERKFVPPISISVESPHTGVGIEEKVPASLEKDARQEKEMTRKGGTGSPTRHAKNIVAELSFGFLGGGQTPKSFPTASAHSASDRGGDDGKNDIEEDGSWHAAGITGYEFDNESVSSNSSGTSFASAKVSMAPSYAGGCSVATEGSWRPAGGTKQLFDSGASVASGSVYSESSWRPAGRTREFFDSAVSVASGSVRTENSWRPAGGTREFFDSGSSVASGSVMSEGSWMPAGVTSRLLDASSVTSGSVRTEGSWRPMGSTQDPISGVTSKRSQNTDSAMSEESDDDLSGSWNPAGAVVDLLNDDASMASMSTWNTFYSSASRGGEDQKSIISNLTNPAEIYQRAGENGTDVKNDPKKVVWELYRVQGLLRSVLERKGGALTD